MKKSLAALLIVIFATTAIAAPINQQQIASSARWVFHLDQQQFLASEIGTLTMQEIKEHGVDEKLNALRELFGSNPLQDIYSITIYGPDNDEANAVALINGKFDKTKLLSLLTLNETYEKDQYHDYTMHHWTDDKHGKPQVGTFASDSLIVLSQTSEAVKLALDVLDGETDNLADTDKATYFDSMPENTIIVAGAEGLGELAGDNANAAILKNTNMLAFIVGEKEGNFKISLNLQAKTPELAIQMQQMAQGFMALAALKANEIDGATPLLNAIKIETTDNNVSIDFAYPSKQLFELIKKHSDNVEINIDIGAETATDENNDTGDETATDQQ